MSKTLHETQVQRINKRKKNHANKNHGFNKNENNNNEHRGKLDIIVNGFLYQAKRRLIIKTLEQEKPVNKNWVSYGLTYFNFLISVIRLRVLGRGLPSRTRS